MYPSGLSYWILHSSSQSFWGCAFEAFTGEAFDFFAGGACDLIVGGGGSCWYRL